MGASSLFRRGNLPVLLAFAGLALALTFPLVLHLGDSVPSDARDPMYALWLLSWDVRAVAGGLAHFADGNIFYPHHGVVFYGDVVPALAAFYAPLVVLTRHPVAAYNILFLLSFVLSAYGAFLLVKRLSGSRSAGFIAGLIFAFFPYRFAHLGHLELLFCGWIPFCFLFLHRYFDDPSPRNMLGVAVFYVLQVSSCAYYGYYLTLFLGLTGLYLVVRTGAWRRPRFWRDAGLAAVLAAAALGPYFWGMVRVHERMLFTRALWEVKFFSAEMQSYLAAPPINRVWGWLSGELGAQEWQLFPGLVSVLLSLAWVFPRWKAKDAGPAVAAPAPAPSGNGTPAARASRVAPLPWGFRLWDAANAALFLAVVYLGIWGGRGVTVAGIWISTRTLQDPVALLLASLLLRAIASRRARVRIAAAWRPLSPAEKIYPLIVIAAWLLSFGPVIRILGREIIAGPYALFFAWLPGFKGMRVPSRFAVMVRLGLAVLSGWGVVRLADRTKTKSAARLVAAAAAGLIVVESLSIPIPLSPVPVGGRVPPIYADVARLPESAVLVELPMPARDADESDEAPAVYFSSIHRRRIVNGYSGNAPAGYRLVREAMESFPSEATLGLLRDLGVGYALIHGRGYRAPKGEEMIGRLAAFGGLTETVADRDGDRLIRLDLPPAPPAPSAEGLRAVGDPRAWRAAASLNPQDAGFAFDGDPATAWSTGYPQRAGDAFEVDFGETLEFREIDLRLGSNPLDFPRDFAVDASADGQTWTRVFERKGFFPAVDKATIEDVRSYAVKIRVAPTAARVVRIALTGSHPERHWSIAEIGLFD